MIRVAALTQGRFVPSARYRVRQNIQKLKKHDIDVSEYFPVINVYEKIPFGIDSWPRFVRLPFVALWQGMKVGSRWPHVYHAGKYNVTWLQRELLPGWMTLEKYLKKPVVFDVDDAIWLTERSNGSISEIAKISDVIIAGNQYIADWFSAYNGNVSIVPTGVDIDRFEPLEKRQNDIFTIGWVGTRGNLIYLKDIEPVLSRLMKKYGDIRLLIVSDQVPDLSGVTESKIKFLPWSEDMEVRSIQMMDAGIMPLPDNEWARGKCSFKMLQYMSCGIPVVVSPVGMNAEVLKTDDFGFGASNEMEWFDALEYLYLNRTVAREMGKRGREVVAAKFSTDLVSLKIAELLKAVT
ncbi:glycosyltransferase family 4 protein [Desulfolithobacter sp.]